MAKQQSLRDEQVMQVSPFNSNVIRKDLQAAATQIRDLFLLLPGTIPNIPNMGIGIQRFQFEIDTPEIIERLRSFSLEQINTYIPDIPIKNLSFEHKLKNSEISRLICLIELSDGQNILINFEKKLSNSEIISEFIVR